MYVRWKTKKLTGSRTGNRSLYAVLVSSERRQGKPRQKVIKHLGYINEELVTSADHRDRFWRQVEIALATVSITPEQRAKVEAKLREVVPPTSREQSPRDAEGRFVVIREMLPEIEGKIDWDGEFRQLSKGWIELHGSDRCSYLLSPATFSMMDLAIRSRIRMRITLRLVQSSLDSINRVWTKTLPGASKMYRVAR